MDAWGAGSYTVDRVHLRRVRLPLARAFETSSHRKASIEHILVCIESTEGAIGWGECATPADPYYGPETTDTAWLVLQRYLAPRLLGRTWRRPAEVLSLLGDIRGHNFAKAGLEMACWDLACRANAVSVASALGGTRPWLEGGVSLGLEPTLEGLLDQAERFVAEGYHRLKLKIAPGRDVEPAGALRTRFPDIALTADANGAYTSSARDRERLRALDGLGLTMIEQPLGADDLVGHAELGRLLTTPICLDESITSAESLNAALALGACRIVNIKVSRLGGLEPARRAHDICVDAAVPVWCGGMHEFGVGRAANIAVASLPGFTLPGDIAGSDRAYIDDVVEPPIRALEGRLQVPFDRPGLGVDVIAERTRAGLVAEVELTSQTR